MNAFILLAVVVTAAVLLMPRLAGATGWRATITPLASIIGSGFLVLGPILETSYGRYAPAIMVTLCLIAYLYGAAIRFNIAVIEEDGHARSRFEQRTDVVASWSLGFAYIISVAYYLNLFGAFGVSLTPVNDPLHAKLLTSAVLLLILVVGWTRGFSALERMEQMSVNVKLAVIAGLLVGLAFFFGHKMSASELTFQPSSLTGWPAITLAFGLLITVQGFETSRYLGEEYDAQTRIRSMRHAQWLSTAIYMIYIGFVAYVFDPGEVALKETGIISMMAIVAPILPALLVAAALSAQFSAAVADTGGAGGLFSELTNARITPARSYILLVAVGLVLTWFLHVFDIIAYASRAFALYYALQALIAARAARRRARPAWQTGLYSGLALLGFMIVAFGTPAEH